jgi:SpoVK/Ycf46/Vps4 family AAA+-type ATPase
MPAPRHKETLSVDVKEFGDLVKLVKTWGPQFRTDTDYNIDLAALVRVQEELEQLDAMIGLKNFKNSVLDQILYFVQNLHVDGKDSDFLHTILCGPPGTGKTEVAKILGKLYSKIGILRSGTFKKVTRSDLVGGFLGQTALKTSKVIQEALGGCLFIDEAYSLASAASGGGTTDTYSKECLDTLCEALSDNKANLMVIIAGYEADLSETIFKANRGLESRFIWRFVLDNYTAADLRDIFMKKVRDNRWIFDDKPSPPLEVAWFEKHKAEFPHFGRDMELLFSYTKCCHGRRIYGKPDACRKVLILEDVNQGLKMLLQNRRQKETFQIPGFYV